MIKMKFSKKKKMIKMKTNIKQNSNLSSFSAFLVFMFCWLWIALSLILFGSEWIVVNWINLEMQPPISMALAECVLLNFEWILAMMKYCVPLTCPLIDVIHCLPFRILYYNKILIFFVLFSYRLLNISVFFLFFFLIYKFDTSIRNKISLDETWSLYIN